jgi:hydrogenase maturation protease
VSDAVVVIGVGNALRGDDGAGPALAAALRARRAGAGVRVVEHDGEALGLIAAWDGARAAVIVDAVRSGAAPGTVVRHDASARALPAGTHGTASTHAIGVAAAIELGRALGRLPPRLVVYGVEGAEFATGAPLSEPVAAVVPGLADAVLAEAFALAAAAASAADAPVAAQKTGDSV